MPSTERLIDAADDPMQAPVLVASARGPASREAIIDAIDAAIADRDAVVQSFDPAAVYGQRHLEAAARRALRAHADDRATARELGVEIALYAAGTTQIDEAFATVGVPVEAEALVLCGVGPDREAAVEAVLDTLDLDRDDAVVGEDVEALDRLGIAEAARRAVPPDELSLLVLEHVALLDARK